MLQVPQLDLRILIEVFGVKERRLRSADGPSLRAGSVLDLVTGHDDDRSLSWVDIVTARPSQTQILPAFQLDLPLLFHVDVPDEALQRILDVAFGKANPGAIFVLILFQSRGLHTDSFVVASVAYMKKKQLRRDRYDGDDSK